MSLLKKKSCQQYKFILSICILSKNSRTAFKHNVRLNLAKLRSAFNTEKILQSTQSILQVLAIVYRVLLECPRISGMQFTLLRIQNKNRRLWTCKTYTFRVNYELVRKYENIRIYTGYQQLLFCNKQFNLCCDQ